MCLSAKNFGNIVGKGSLCVFENETASDHFFNMSIGSDNEQISLVRNSSTNFDISSSVSVSLVAIPCTIVPAC